MLLYLIGFACFVVYSLIGFCVGAFIIARYEMPFDDTPIPLVGGMLWPLVISYLLIFRFIFPLPIRIAIRIGKFIGRVLRRREVIRKDAEMLLKKAEETK